MCETLLEVLVSGASFPSCLTALHLLVLLGQLFSFSTGTLLATSFFLPMFCSNVYYLTFYILVS
jgi:hypothetical protein